MSMSKMGVSGMTLTGKVLDKDGKYGAEVWFVTPDGQASCFETGYIYDTKDAANHACAAKIQDVFDMLRSYGVTMRADDTEVIH